MPLNYTPAENAAFPAYPIPIVANGDVNEAETWNAASRRVIDGLQNLRTQGNTLDRRTSLFRTRGLFEFERDLQNKILLESIQGISFPITGAFTFTFDSSTVTVSAGNLSVQIRPHTYIFPGTAYADRVRVAEVLSITSLRLEHPYRGTTSTGVSAQRLGPVFTFFEDFRDLSKRHINSNVSIDTTLQFASGVGSYIAISTSSEACSRAKLLWEASGSVTAGVNFVGDLVNFVAIPAQDRWITLPTGGSSPTIRITLGAGVELYNLVFLAIS